MINVHELNAEELKYLNKFGKISRPFSKELRAGPQGLQEWLKEFQYRFTVQALDWPVTGVDVSYWQGDIDWDILQTKIDFAIIRAGYGNTTIDPRAEENRQACIDREIPYGLYWYVKPGKNFTLHAESFFKFWEKNPGQLEPSFDLEETGGLLKTSLESWYKKMYDRYLDLSGYALKQLMTYTSPGFLNRAIGLTNWLKKTKLWDANWTSALQPWRPNEWLVPNLPWGYWQHAVVSSIGYGVQSKKIDLNRYNGSVAKFEDTYDVILNPPPPPTDEDLVVYEKLVKITAYPHLNVRDLPDGNDLGELKPDTQVPIVKTKGDWYRIDGWIHSDYVKEL